MRTRTVSEPGLPSKTPKPAKSKTSSSFRPRGEKKGRKIAKLHFRSLLPGELEGTPSWRGMLYINTDSDYFAYTLHGIAGTSQCMHMLYVHLHGKGFYSCADARALQHSS